MFILLARLLLLLLFCSAPSSAVSTSANNRYETVWHWDMMIPVIANATLSSDVYVPVPKTDNETFPLIIFPNSWMMPQVEYLAPARSFAERGYVAWEYETRGWFSSSGFIDCAGPLDRSDVSSVIDHITTFADVFHIDMSRIAFAGISYGAGISLMAAGHDSRVTTAVAMSGWGDLVGGLYYDRTPSYQLDLLYATGKLLGRPSPSLTTNLHDILSHKNMTEVHQWASDRSPESLYMNAYKNRQVPIMMSNNYLDSLFFPQAVLDFFLELDCPKRLILNNGGHAQAEIPGLIPGFTGSDYVWENVNNWIDHWIKGIDTGVMDTPLIRMQHGATVFVDTFEGFSTYPDANKTENYKRFFNPRGAGKYGTLVTQNRQHINPAVSVAKPTADQIRFTADPPFAWAEMDASAWGFKPATYNLSDASRETSVVYYAETLATDTAFCGMPALQLALAPTSTTSQIFTYLYDVHPDGSAEVLSNGMHTQWPEDVPAPLGGYVDVKMRCFCRTLQRGHKIAVGFVLANSGFVIANNSTGFRNGIAFGPSFSSFFSMPVLCNNKTVRT